MIRALRIAWTRAAYRKATAEYVAYMGQPAGGYWSLGMADALLVRLRTTERKLSHLINGV